MLNLLLRQDRHDLKKEYSLRFLNVFLMAGILILIITAVLFFSISAFVWTENNIVNDQLATVSGEDNTQQREDLHEMINVINNQITKLQSVKPEYSGFLNEILKAQPNGVGLNFVNFIPTDSETIKVEINAQATLRENMIEYSNNLKANSQFANVDLPLSNLTQGSNVIFKITFETDSLKNEFEAPDSVEENEEVEESEEVEKNDDSELNDQENE